MTILKHYPIEFTYKQLVPMRSYARIDACRVLADGSAFLVAILDEGMGEEDVEIAMYQDGDTVTEQMGDPGKYLGTIQNPVDMHVYHVYDVRAVM
jgi:hypothetical protein